MIHGCCVSIGCYAMTDKYINEVYTLAQVAFEGEQTSFRVYIFPFDLYHEKLALYKDHPWYEFWLNLKQGYDFFQPESGAARCFGEKWNVLL